MATITELFRKAVLINHKQTTMKNNIHELEALQNAVEYTNLPGLKVYEKPSYDDKRKTIKMFFLNINNETISPVLDYENMNHFIHGFSKAKKLFSN